MFRSSGESVAVSRQDSFVGAKEDCVANGIIHDPVGLNQRNF